MIIDSHIYGIGKNQEIFPFESSFPCIRPTLESFERVLSAIVEPLPSERGDFWFYYLPFLSSDRTSVEVERKYLQMRRTLPIFYMLALGYAGALQLFLRKKEDYSNSLIYEDLVEKPRIMARKMLKDLGIPEALTANVLRGLDSDSQNDMFSQVPTAQRVSGDNWKKIDGLLKEVDSPVQSAMMVSDLRNIVKRN